MSKYRLSCPPPGTTVWPGVSISFQLSGEGSPLRQLAYPQNLVNRLSARQCRGRVRRRKVFLGSRHALLSTRTRTSTRVPPLSRLACSRAQARFFVRWNVNSDEDACKLQTRTFRVTPSTTCLPVEHSFCTVRRIFRVLPRAWNGVSRILPRPR